MRRLFILLIVIGIGFWLYRVFTAPQPGEFVPSQGDEHIPIGTAVTNYSSNPPTSGPHHSDWERAGRYDRVLPDERLVHSLEHGYIVISYNCARPLRTGLPPQSAELSGKVQQIVPGALAHEGEESSEEEASSASSSATPDNQNLSGWRNNPDCQNLVSRLTNVMERSRKDRLILVPRPNLDTTVALTAWTRIDKMDVVDEERILRFINAYHNRGPERTQE